MSEPNSPKTQISVIGAGSWATALVKILSEGNIEINWWVRKKEYAEHIRTVGRNPNYLSSIKIDTKKVTVFEDLSRCIMSSEIVFLVVPSAFVGACLDQLGRKALKGKVLVSAIKGMIPEQNFLITEHMTNHFQVPKQNCCVVAGPCHSEEIALERRSYLTIGGCDMGTTAKIAQLLTCRYVKAEPRNDLEGVEYAAIMKNIYAIAGGIARGLSYGDNFQAVLISNAMQEIEQFLNRRFPRERDLLSSAYLGDVLVTAYSQFSRNRTFGHMIGRGYSVSTAKMEMNMIAEGYYAVKCLFEVLKENIIDYPVLNAVYNILYGKISPRVEFQILSEKLN